MVSIRKDAESLTRATAFAAIVVGCCLASARGTEPAPTQAQEQSKGATSLLDSTRSNGRIGGFEYRGALVASPGQNSRFSNNARYGKAGNIEGVDLGSSASRFQSGSSAFKSRNDFSALILRNEYRRARNAALAQEQTRRGTSQNEPRLIVATPPEPIPYGMGRKPRYGTTREEALAEKQALDAQFAARSLPQEHAIRDDGVYAPQQQLWMRGPAPRGMANGRVDDFNADYRGTRVFDDFFDYTRSNFTDVDGNQYDYGWASASNPLGGALDLGLNAYPITQPLVSEQERQAAFIECLETLILESPTVNLLSPVQIDFQDGVATIRGVVPTPSSRAAAGAILLSDPRVTKVNNQLAYVRPDDDKQGTTESMNRDLPSSPSPSETTNETPQTDGGK